MSTAGSEATVDYSPSAFKDGLEVAERWDSGSGPVFRMVAGFDDAGRPEAWFAFPRGNSGDPDSPHWDDTLEDWVEGLIHISELSPRRLNNPSEMVYQGQKVKVMILNIDPEKRRISLSYKKAYGM